MAEKDYIVDDTCLKYCLFNSAAYSLSLFK